jgi:nitroreductase
MNQTLESILNRRSIRSFKPEQIKDEELNAILDAGKYAPSAMNEQAWHFTVIQNKDVLHKINNAIKTAFINSGDDRFIARAKAENFRAFYDAPTFIIVSVDEKAIAPQADSALALGNLFLAAEALGIGSCWIHSVNFLYTTEEGKALFRELGLPNGYVPQASGAFGYSAIPKPNPAPRKDGTVTIIK